MIKYFRFDYDYVLWGISYTNLNMLLATVPSYESEPLETEKVEKVESLEDIFK